MSGATEQAPETTAVEPDEPASASRGFIFAATGEIYITLARRAARNLRQVHPDAEIDLFTDVSLDDPVFSQVHRLSESYFRPKIEALLRSRFDRTIYLDADAVAFADLMPVFDVLARYEIAGVQDRRLNSPNAMRFHTKPLPSTFPQINGGMLAVRKTPATQTLLESWLSEMKRTEARTDQPSLRQLLYDMDVRLCVLPPAYNLLTFNELKSWWGYFGAPRVLHSPALYKVPQNNPSEPFTMAEVVGRVNAYRMRILLRSDYELSPQTPEKARNMYAPIRTGLRGLLNRLMAFAKRSPSR